MRSEEEGRRAGGREVRKEGGRLYSVGANVTINGRKRERDFVVVVVFLRPAS